jgi:hypothetical protein
MPKVKSWLGEIAALYLERNRAKIVKVLVRAGIDSDTANKVVDIIIAAVEKGL